MMKKRLFLLLIIPTLSFAQNTINHFWNQSLWIIEPAINKHSKEFHLSIPQKNQEVPNSPNIYYGQSLTFNHDGTFISTYRTDCGYDCLHYAEGTFKKIDKAHIHLQLDFYSQRGPVQECKTIEDKNHYDLGIFTLIPTPNGYTLIKTK
jgi:hypothetical protein